MSEIPEIKEDNFIEVEEPQQVMKVKKPITEEKRRQLDEAKRKDTKRNVSLKNYTLNLNNCILKKQK